MKKSIYITLAFIILFCLLLLFLFTKSEKVTDLNKDLLQPAVPQTVDKREWKEIDFEYHSVSEKFISSAHMRFGKDNLIYIADNNQKVVKQFDVHGNLLKTFGTGEGKGPGEFLIIIDILLDQSGNLWALDDRNNRVTIFNVEDEEDWQILDFPEVFNRVIPAGNGGYWFEKRFDNQMRRYRLSGDYLNDAEAIVDTPTLWSFVLESYSALVPDGSIIQSQYHTNMFLKYSPEGEILYFREPIEFMGLPKIDPYYANDVGRMNTVDFSSWEQITRNPQVVNNTFQLFVHQKERNKDEWRQGFMDVYDLKTGDYMYSYELPEQLETLAISNEYLAGVSEELGKIIIWKEFK